MFSVRDFTPGTYDIVFNHSSEPGNFDTTTPLNVGPAGNGTWDGFFYVRHYDKPMTITFKRGGDSFSKAVNW